MLAGMKEEEAEVEGEVVAEEPAKEEESSCRARRATRISSS